MQISIVEHCAYQRQASRIRFTPYVKASLFATWRSWERKKTMTMTKISSQKTCFTYGHCPLNFYSWGGEERWPWPRFPQEMLGTHMVMVLWLLFRRVLCHVWVKDSLDQRPISERWFLSDLVWRAGGQKLQWNLCLAVFVGDANKMPPHLHVIIAANLLQSDNMIFTNYLNSCKVLHYRKILAGNHLVL